MASIVDFFGLGMREFVLDADNVKLFPVLENTKYKFTGAAVVMQAASLYSVQSGRLRLVQLRMLGRAASAPLREHVAGRLVSE